MVLHREVDGYEHRCLAATRFSVACITLFLSAFLARSLEEIDQCCPAFGSLPGLPFPVDPQTHPHRWRFSPHQCITGPTRRSLRASFLHKTPRFFRSPLGSGLVLVEAALIVDTAIFTSSSLMAFGSSSLAGSCVRHIELSVLV